jgi:hypothetical protein
MKKILLLLLFACTVILTFAQKEWYGGIDIGPKYDLFRVIKMGNSAGNAKLKIIGDVAAIAGLKLGVNLDKKYTFQTGIYKNDYKVKFDLISSKNNLLFDNELVNTLNTYMIPINLMRRYPLSNEKQVFTVGFGFSFLVNEKTDLTGQRQSDIQTVENNGIVIDEMKYRLYKHALAGGIFTGNLFAGLDIALFERMFFSIEVCGRLGLSGNDEFSIDAVETKDIADETTTFKISNNGGAVQFVLGFKYFFKTNTEE